MSNRPNNLVTNNINNNLSIEAIDLCSDRAVSELVEASSAISSCYGLNWFGKMAGTLRSKMVCTSDEALDHRF